MAKFLVLYRAQNSARELMTRATVEQAKAGMDAWLAWANRAGSALIDMGAPLGDRTAIGGAASPEHFSGYSILEAANLNTVTALLSDHPHLHMPGSTIEVMEFLAMPSMG